VKLDPLIDEIYSVLPADTCATIQAKLEEAGVTVSIHMVNYAIKHLRRNSAHYNWTIPHVKRGIPISGEEERYFSVRVEATGRMVTNGNNINLRQGVTSTVKQLTTEAFNNARSLEAFAGHVRNQVAAERLKDWAADFNYIGRKGNRLIELIDGTNGA
jgi:hypothetical protein